MRKIVLSFLLTAILAFVPNLAINAESDCDLVLDFETESLLLSYSIVKLNGELGSGSGAGSIVIGNNPSGEGQSLYATCGGYDNAQYVKLNITLPTGKTIGDYESILSFDAYYPTALGTFKTVQYSINNGSKTNLQQISGDDNWRSHAISLTTLVETTTSFSIEIGCRDFNKGSFYIDNIRLNANPDNCIIIPDNTFTATLNPGSGTCESASVTEATEDAGVTLPSATPSAKCAAAGWSFAGWSGSAVDETTVVPTLISAGNYAIVDNITLYAVYYDGTEYYNSNPNCSASLNGTVIDGYYMVEDFEGETTSIEYAMATGSGTAVVTAAQGNPENSLHTTSGGHGHGWISITITLPIGKTLSDYEDLYFDIYYGMENENKYKSVTYSFNGESKTEIDYISDTPDLGKWKELCTSLDGVSVTNNKFTFEIGYNGGSTANFYLDNIRFKENITAVTWVGGTTDWTVAGNWNPQKVPDATIDVTIPGNVTNFPVLTTPGAACKTITFAPCARLGGQNNLTTYEKAIVQYKLKPGRWHMLSMPFSTTAESFYLKGEPHNLTQRTWLQKFKSSQEDNASWEYYRGLEQSMPIGEAFAYWIEELTSDSVSFEIETAALAGAEPTVPALHFGEDTDYVSFFALVGNPFMTSIDFDALYTANNTKILQNYQVWTGSGFAGYSSNGQWGQVTNLPTINQYIAPLQAFFVERKDNTVTGSLSFNLATVQTTNATTELRSATVSKDKLDITASNETASVLTFIANRGEGQSARKLMNGFTDIPDVYTLAEDAKTALGANIVTTYDITVPIGLATSYAGGMSLTFSGMENYDAKIGLIDTEEDLEIDLTGKDSYRYDFNYTPPTTIAKDENDEDKEVPIADESRFYIAFSPMVITDINEVAAQKTLIYAKNNAIHIIGSSDNPIRQIFVYDMTGRMLFSETNLNAPVFTVKNLAYGPSDVYLVKVITKKGVENVKLVR